MSLFSRTAIQMNRDDRGSANVRVTDHHHGREWIHHVWAGDALLGFLVFHSMFNGTARGGIRLEPDVTEDEIRILAEGMTLKFGILGLPQGGAKAGIRADPDAPEEERFELLLTFVQALAPLLKTRTFIPGPDMGITTAMVRRALVQAGIPVRPRELRGERSAYFTALTVFQAASHTARAVGLKPSDARIAIEGFGKVGSSLAQAFSEVSARIVAVSTSHGALLNSDGFNVAELLTAYAAHGSEFVLRFEKGELAPRRTVFEVPVDILCPCARHNSIRTEDTRSIQAKIIAPGANQPYDAQAEAGMAGRGIVCLPYWLANCGGTLGETMEFAGWRDHEIREFSNRRMEEHVRWLIDKIRSTDQIPTDILKQRSLARHRLVESRGSSPLRRFGLGAYQRGWLPVAVMRPLSRNYFEREVFQTFGGDH